VIEGDFGVRSLLSENFWGELFVSLAPVDARTRSEEQRERERVHWM